jgi:hypothetical protein
VLQLDVEIGEGGRKANLAPSVNPGLVLRDPCAEALEDREPWPCVGVSASSEGLAKLMLLYGVLLVGIFIVATY